MTSSLLNQSPTSTEDLFQRHLGMLPTGETDTLSVPLALARIIWSPTCDQHNPRLQSQDRSKTGAHHHHQHSHHQHGSSSCCSHSHSDDDLGLSRSQFHKIGTAFEKCCHELRHFIRWDRDTCPWCVVVNDEVHDDVTRKLRELGFFEDATGKHQDCLSRKANPKSKCRSGVLRASQPTKTNSSTTAPTNSAVGTPAAKSSQAPAKPPSTAALPSQPASESSTATPSATSSKASSSSSSSSPSAPATKSTTKSVGEPAVASANVTPTKVPIANLTSKNTTTLTPASTARKPASSREQQKKPEPTISPSLLADCRKFESCAESNGEKRTHISNNASLKEVMRSLNRAVLIFCTSHRYNLIYAELASLVALLNYAAAFYYVYADSMEVYMGKYFEKEDIQHLFGAIYRNRADYIETEEYCTSGSSSNVNAGYPKERAARRTIIQNEFNKMVPDVTDLRDGAQTILFTFTWIHYTAFAGIDKAVASTLHTLMPLMQTIIIRTTRQAYHLRGSLIAATAKGALNESTPPKGLDLQWDLVELSNALQNLSGCDAALFAPTAFSEDHKKSKKNGSKKQKKGTVGWPETVVSAPYTASLYTAAAADITYRFLNKIVAAEKSGLILKQPEKEVFKKCSPSCKCSAPDEEQKPIVEELDQRTTLIERKQRGWKPLMFSDQTTMGKKKKNKSKKKKKKQKEPETPLQSLVKAGSGYRSKLGLEAWDEEDECESDEFLEDGVSEILMGRIDDVASYNIQNSAKTEIETAVQGNKQAKVTATTSLQVEPPAPAGNGAKPSLDDSFEYWRSLLTSDTSSKSVDAPSTMSSAPIDSSTPAENAATRSEGGTHAYLRSLLTSALTDPKAAQKMYESILPVAEEMASRVYASGILTGSNPATSTLPPFDFPELDSESPLTSLPSSYSPSPTFQLGWQAPDSSPSQVPPACSVDEASTEIPPMPSGLKEYTYLVHGDVLHLGKMCPEWARFACNTKARTIREAGLLESEEFLHAEWKRLYKSSRRTAPRGSSSHSFGFGFGPTKHPAGSLQLGSALAKSSSSSELPNLWLNLEESKPIPPAPTGVKDILLELLGDRAIPSFLAHFASNPFAESLRQSGLLDRKEVVEFYWSTIYTRVRTGTPSAGEKGLGPFTPSEYASLATAAPPEDSTSNETTWGPGYRLIPCNFKEIVEELIGDDPLGAISTALLPPELEAKSLNPSTLNESGFLGSKDYLELLWRGWKDVRRKRLKEEGRPTPDPAYGIDIDELKEELMHVIKSTWNAAKVLTEEQFAKDAVLQQGQIVEPYSI
ncbi:uncharacterized protein UDID_05807 [Ustilago sp. UG-2017a]|nr:uncharacterized protein UDID_05807 [Ustilago sp. UG-2017a]